MMKPKANEMPSRSAPEIAGVDLPARTSVATTDPGPTNTSSAVPSVSATARCDNECSCTDPSPLADDVFDNAEYRSGDATTGATTCQPAPVRGCAGVHLASAY